MLHFYDGQIRRYITQVIRVLSNFTVKYGDGTLHRIPVMYGDADRQVASILRQNSENVINSVPRISVYISELQMDKDRLADSTYTGNVHIRERDIVDGQYTQGQGRNYTVERLMPTPFNLTLKCDIWSANNDQKLQILEQILVLFNPSLELQTTDNYIDWTSLTVLNLGNINWSSRTVPVGTDTPIDIATLTLSTPIWISPPVKVKHLGVITSIITSIYQGATSDKGDYIDGLGQPLTSGETTLSTLLSQDIVTVTEFNIEVFNGQAIVLGPSEDAIPREPTLEIPARQGTPINWDVVFNKYPGKYIAGSTSLFLKQKDGTDIVGTVAIDPIDTTLLTISWDNDTAPKNDFLAPYDNQYKRANGLSAGTIDAIIDPQKVYPGNGMQNVVAGDRFLIIEDIIQDTEAWGNFAAFANDIIEWNGTQWTVIFNAQDPNQHLIQTNIYSGVQYVWNNVMWSKSFEGVYKAGQWRIEL